jgi:hypothetical protein
VVNGNSLGFTGFNSVLDLGEEQGRFVVDDPQLRLEHLHGQALGHLADKRVQHEVQRRLVERSELRQRTNASWVISVLA